MSFQLGQIDYSQLPKVRTHAQLGFLGDPAGCSIWNPLTYPTCSTWLIQGRTELAEAHNAIIALANLWNSTITDIGMWPESQAKTNALTEARTKAEEAYRLVQTHSQVQSEYESKIAPFKSIGLAGLKEHQARLGIILAPWAIITLSSLVVTALGAWGVTSALSLKASYEANTAFYNQFAEYYKTCQELAKQGKPCTVAGPSSTPPGSAWSSQVIMLALLGLGIAVMVASRR